MTTTVSGVWVPLITPFKDGTFDAVSYRRLIAHYLAAGVDGFFPLGTTGEAPTLDEGEIETIVAETVTAVAGRRPIFIGVGGNATAKVIRAVRRLDSHAFDGIVSVCPYYNRPSQDGLFDHFKAVSEATDRQILIYNIPYRTSVNLQNETMFRLAALRNIVGCKDSSGSIAQSLDLLRDRPEGFAVLTGEDALFYTMLANGADGGILAACHLATDQFMQVHARMRANDHHGARAAWKPLAPLIPKLFQEANPMPLKHALWRLGLIASPECRLPLGRVSASLAHELDGYLGRMAQAAA